MGGGNCEAIHAAARGYTTFSFYHETCIFRQKLRPFLTQRKGYYAERCEFASL